MQIVLCKKKDKDYDRLILKFSNIIKIPRRLINGKESVLLYHLSQGPRTVLPGPRPPNLTWDGLTSLRCPEIPGPKAGEQLKTDIRTSRRI